MAVSQHAVLLDHLHRRGERHGVEMGAEQDRGRRLGPCDAGEQVAALRAGLGRAGVLLHLEPERLQLGAHGLCHRALALGRALDLAQADEVGEQLLALGRAGAGRRAGHRDQAGWRAPRRGAVASRTGPQRHAASVATGHAAPMGKIIYSMGMSVDGFIEDHRRRDRLHRILTRSCAASTTIVCVSCPASSGAGACTRRSDPYCEQTWTRAARAALRGRVRRDLPRDAQGDLLDHPGGGGRERPPGARERGGGDPGAARPERGAARPGRSRAWPRA